MAALLVLAAASPVGALTDAMGVRRPQTAPAADVRSSLAGRVDALRDRYERRVLSAPPAVDEPLPEPPPAASVPPPPDAPDGEITRQRLRESVR